MRELDVFAGCAVLTVRAERERATVLRATVPLLRAAARAGLTCDCATVVGAIGSANTVRIDNKVEQIKNAPASKNTVPIAFLYASAIFWFFIELS